MQWFNIDRLHRDLGLDFRQGWVILSQCVDSMFRWPKLCVLSQTLMKGEVSAKNCNWSLSRPHARSDPALCLLTIHTGWVELAVKDLSVAFPSEYTEGSDCSVHRDTMRLKGGPGLSARVSPWRGWPGFTFTPAAAPSPRQIWPEGGELGGVMNQKDSCVLQLTSASLDSQRAVTVNNHQSTTGCTAWSSPHSVTHSSLLAPYALCSLSAIPLEMVVFRVPVHCAL